MAFITMRSGLPLPVMNYLSMVSDQILPDEDSSVTYKRISLIRKPPGITHEYEYQNMLKFFWEGHTISQVYFQNHPLFPIFDELHTTNQSASG